MTQSTAEDLTPTMARMYEDGMSIRAIAEDLDRSYGFVHQTLKASGVKLRPRGGSRRKAATALEEGGN